MCFGLKGSMKGRGWSSNPAPPTSRGFDTHCACWLGSDWRDVLIPPEGCTSHRIVDTGEGPRWEWSIGYVAAPSTVRVIDSLAPACATLTRSCVYTFLYVSWQIAASFLPSFLQTASGGNPADRGLLFCTITTFEKRVKCHNLCTPTCFPSVFGQNGVEASHLGVHCLVRLNRAKHD